MNQTKQFRYKCEWNTINWKSVERSIFKLQKRIYRASLNGNQPLVRKLQKLLVKSHNAKLLAVRKVTQDNKGKRTAGIDGFTAQSSSQRQKLVRGLNLNKKASPIRRIWISKPGKNEKRPLGIPTMEDRCRQALVKAALEPEWEAKFEPNSYGFRPGRSCHDAIEAIFCSVSKKQAYVLDADIAECFDRINHQALLNKMRTSPTLRRIIKSWLKAGIIENGQLFTNESGTSQGSILSPLLANIALHGMENDIKAALHREIKDHICTKRKTATGWKTALSIIRYADDLVVIHENIDIVLKAREYLTAWLQPIGLELKSSKTRICHTSKRIDNATPGFKFLGFHIRHYPTRSNKLGFKTIIKPHKDAVKKHLREIKLNLRTLRGAPQEKVISTLNPIIRGWVNYNRYAVSRKIFERLSHLTTQKLLRWSYWQHPNKGKRWTVKKYFRAQGKDRWRFKSQEGLILASHQEMKITRFTKVRGTKSPYNGDFLYWSARMKKYPQGRRIVAQLLQKQKGKCTRCDLFFKTDDVMEIYQKDGNRNNYMIKNSLLLHRHCNNDAKQISMFDKHHIIEEPDELKGSCPVLKPSTGGDTCA